MMKTHWINSKVFLYWPILYSAIESSKILLGQCDTFHDNHELNNLETHFGQG